MFGILQVSGEGGEGGRREGGREREGREGERGEGGREATLTDRAVFLLVCRGFILCLGYCR